jgi:hypothetical protein
MPETLIPEILIPESKRPGIAPWPSRLFLEWISLEIHSAAASKSAVADFDMFQFGGLANGLA